MTSAEERAAVALSVCQQCSIPEGPVFVAGGYALERLIIEFEGSCEWESQDIDIFFGAAFCRQLEEAGQLWWGCTGEAAELVNRWIVGALMGAPEPLRACSLVVNSKIGAAVGFYEDEEDRTLAADGRTVSRACRKVLRGAVPPLSRPRRWPIKLCLRASVCAPGEDPDSASRTWDLNLIFGRWRTAEELVQDFDLSVCKVWLHAEAGQLRVGALDEAREDVGKGIVRLSETAYQPSWAYKYIPAEEIAAALTGEPCSDIVRTNLARQASRVRKYATRGFRFEPDAAPSHARPAADAADEPPAKKQASTASSNCPAA